MAERVDEKSKVIHGPSLLSEYDVYLFRQGNHYRVYQKLGAHRMEVDGQAGTLFSVFAPNAKEVSVMGDFNEWDRSSHPLAIRWDGSGIWEGFVPDAKKGQLYKYHIKSSFNNYEVDKGDPFAISWELSPKTASQIWDLEYEWNDDEWMSTRGERNKLEGPISIYELHLGSWRRKPEEDNRYLNYREIAHELADYINEMGFTHVELLPIMEHPFYGSWGYQTAGYFSPTSRFGSPQDFMYFVDYLHSQGIGVILDWVPSHFPSDNHGLVYFDGTHLFEHEDPRKGFHPDWQSYIYNYGRNEVRNFLLASAMFWLDQYHIDGFRVDAVASMLYLDYSRKEGEWIPNEHGGRENIEAINFLRQFNEMVYKEYPDVQTYAEESTAWPMVSRPNYLGGLGFGMKWNMGWMHDTLDYYAKEPVHRKFHHSQLSFSIWYSFFENFVLPLSHDEVVHGKGSLLNKMPGDDWQKFANLRALFGYMFTHPGKKLLFMGGEFGQWKEWNHDTSLDWHLTEFPFHKGMQNWIRDLNNFYKNNPALYERDFENEGFQWIDFGDWQQSVISYMRLGKTAKESIIVVCNLTPVPRDHYKIGVPESGYWEEVLNSDAEIYGGSGQGNYGGVNTLPVANHGQYDSISVNLPPLSVVVFKKELE
ncbi:MAG: 1,4-alpha-glucan branching protein GlgB [candidate division Zixibacteria bacterium]|nr:1,4-alpha-glucan branching protein GlgB [candidate division Zixibacteria bacterium]